MKTLFVLVCVLVAVLADEELGSCPTGTAVAVTNASPCTTDDDCTGTDKCCNQFCTAIAVATNVDPGVSDNTGPLTKEQRHAIRQQKKAARETKKKAKADRLAEKQAAREARKARKAAERAERKRQKQAEKVSKKGKKGKKGGKKKNQN